MDTMMLVLWLQFCMSTLAMCLWFLTVCHFDSLRRRYIAILGVCALISVGLVRYGDSLRRQPVPPSVSSDAPCHPDCPCLLQDTVANIYPVEY